MKRGWGKLERSSDGIRCFSPGMIAPNMFALRFSWTEMTSGLDTGQANVTKGFYVVLTI